MKVAIKILGKPLFEIDGGKSPLPTGDTYMNCVLNKPYPIVMNENMSPAPLTTTDDDLEKTINAVSAFVAKETGYEESEVKFILKTADKYFK